MQTGLLTQSFGSPAVINSANAQPKRLLAVPRRLFCKTSDTKSTLPSVNQYYLLKFGQEGHVLMSTNKTILRNRHGAEVAGISFD